MKNSEKYALIEKLLDEKTELGQLHLTGYITADIKQHFLIKHPYEPRDKELDIEIQDTYNRLYESNP